MGEQSLLQISKTNKQTKNTGIHIGATQDSPKSNTLAALTVF